VLLDLLAHQVLLVLKEILGLLVPLDQKAVQVLQVLVGLQDLLVLLVLKEILGLLVQKVLLVLLDRKEQQVRRVLLDCMLLLHQYQLMI
jgi:hypothetical protein